MQSPINIQNPKEGEGLTYLEFAYERSRLEMVHEGETLRLNVEPGNLLVAQVCVFVFDGVLFRQWMDGLVAFFFVFVFFFCSAFFFVCLSCCESILHGVVPWFLSLRKKSRRPPFLKTKKKEV